MPDSEYKISARNITKIFGKNVSISQSLLSSGASKQEILEKTGDIVGVNQVSFDINSAETFVVMGLSGSGKSTLIRCINKLIAPTDGEILIDDENILAMNGPQLRQLRQRKLGMVFQHFALLPHKSVRDNVAYGLHLTGVDRRTRNDRADQALAEVGLEGWGDMLPASLSGGMKQRVGIARALALDTEILLMDEPFSALDPLIRRDMQNLMIDLQRRLHKTIVFITHDLLEAIKIGDRIAIMKDGAFVQTGNREEIVIRPKDPYVADFVKDVDRARVLKAATLSRQQPEVGPETTTAEIRRLMDETRFKALFVTDDGGKPIGIIDHRAVDAAGHTAASQIMDRQIETVPAGALLVDLYAFCRPDRPIGLVGDDGRLHGSVSPFDLLDRLAQLEASDPEVAA